MNIDALTHTAGLSTKTTSNVIVNAQGVQLGVEVVFSTTIIAYDKAVPQSAILSALQSAETLHLQVRGLLEAI